MRLITRFAGLSTAVAIGLFAASCAVVGPVQRAPMYYATVSQDGTPLRLAYRERGHGKPVLMIHGFGANAYTWRHLEPILAQTHRVIAVDLKGFGRSDKPLDKRYSVRDQAALLAQFIEQKNLKDVTLVGHSLGGGVALVLALDENEKRRKRIARLVLIDSVGYAQKIPLAFNVLRMPVIGPITSFLIPKELQAGAALRIAFHDDTKFNRKDVAEYAEPLRDPGSQHALVYSARQIVPENLGELSARYRTIRIPALVVWCDQDKVIKSHVGWRLHQDIPNSTFKLMRGCGHIPQEERPLETARILVDFLNHK